MKVSMGLLVIPPHIKTLTSVPGDARSIGLVIGPPGEFGSVHEDWNPTLIGRHFPAHSGLGKGFSSQQVPFLR